MTALVRRRMEADLPMAMKARDATRVSVLRTALAAIANAEAVDAPASALSLVEVDRKELTDDDITAIVEHERDELLSAAADMREHGEVAAADELCARAAILDDYLAPPT